MENNTKDIRNLFRSKTVMFIGLFALAIIISLGITLVIEKVVPKFENSAANTATLYIESINNKDFDSFCDCLMPSVADSM